MAGKVKCRNWRKALLAVMFFTLLLLALLVVAPIFERKYARNKMADFFSQEEDFDVLFFGSSHMMNSIYPMELWDKYGIISYNLGSHGEMLPLTYWNIRLAFKYHKPKLAVIDTYGIVKTMAGLNTTDKNIGAIHDSLDAYPISKTKIAAIADLFREKNSLQIELSFLLNFTTYHARWSELDEEDFEAPNQAEKGADVRLNVTSSTMKVDYNSAPEVNITGYESANYLRKAIDYCRQNGVEVLLTYLPFGAAEEERVGYAKYFEKLAKDYKVNYLNFLALKPIENQQIDYYDKGHLNVSGARKITEYVGKYLQDNYKVPDHRKDDKYAEWVNDYNEYIDYKIELLKKSKTRRDVYLMLLAKEEDIDYEIKLSKDFKASKYPMIYIMLNNLAKQGKVDGGAFVGNDDKVIKVVTYDKRTNEKIDEVYF